MARQIWWLWVFATTYLTVIACSCHGQQTTNTIKAVEPDVISIEGGQSLQAVFLTSFPQNSSVLSVTVAGVAAPAFTWVVGSDYSAIQFTAPAVGQVTSGNNYVDLAVTVTSGLVGNNRSVFLAAKIIYVALHYCNPSTETPLYSYDEQKCVVCPDNGVCPGGPRLFATPGFWVAPPLASELLLLDVWKCVPAESCIGGRYEEDPESAEAILDSVCNRSLGYSSEFCAECADGYSRQFDGKCRPCDGAGFVAAVFIADFAFFGLIAALGLLLADATLTTAVHFLLKIQLVWIIGSAVNENLPPSIARVLASLSFAVFDVQFLAIGCLAGIDGAYAWRFFAQLFVLLLVWLVVLGSVAAAWKLCSCWHRPSSFYRYRLVRMALVMATLSYFIISARSIEGLFCKSFNDELRLAVQPDVVCFRDSHLAVTLVSAILLAVVTFGFPVVTYLFLWRRAGMREVSSFKQKFGCLYDVLKTNRWWFECTTFMLWALLALGKTVFKSSAGGKFAWYIIALICYLVALVGLRPYHALWKNTASIVAIVVSLIGAGITFLLETADMSESVVIAFALTFLLLAMLWLVLFSGAFILDLLRCRCFGCCRKADSDGYDDVLFL